MFSPNAIFLVGSLFWRVCVMRTINYLINVDSSKLLARFIPNGFEINERSQPTKIHHVIDIEKLLRVDNLGEFINNTFF